ncbi:coenzyme Q biosynthesis protein Coq4-domain-containing protein [Phakopsora pachyrhizi]|nr:coenzyme Q biosynthesis protein Coq4-domain-containing protein [Phakopsora pachyrhizi]
MSDKQVKFYIFERCLSSSSLSSSHSNHPGKRYPEHIPINGFERAFLAVGSAIASLNDPHRADMIAVLSETTSGPFLSRLRDQMLEDVDGRRLLRDRPRIRTNTIDFERLKTLPSGTFGREYADWLEGSHVSPDARDDVKFIDSPELAYVMQRYRECHDFYHLISGNFPATVSGEIVVKWFELANMGLPVAGISAIFGPLRINRQSRRVRLFKAYLPWALKCGSSCRPLINVYWEENWETPIDELRKRLGIWSPPISWNKFIEEGIRLANNRNPEPNAGT